MIQTAGILFALLAMISWGVGDYFIQKVSRIFGIWKCIFFISITGVIILAPFALHDFSFLHGARSILFIIVAAFIMLIASVFDFEALRQGKLAVMEPIISTELPIAALLAVVLWRESLSLMSWLIIVVIFAGTVLAVTQHHRQLHYHKRIFERGVIFAFTAALCLALLDVVMGASSQTSAPLLTVWLVWIGTGIFSFCYLLAHKQVTELKKNFRDHAAILLMVGVFDMLGWLGFCLASARMSIALTTAIAESYVAITILLGLIINREKILWHQKIGIGVVFISVIVLTLIM